MTSKIDSVTDSVGILRRRSDHHLSRKAYHVLVGTVVMILYGYVFTKERSILIILAATLALGAGDLIRLRFAAVNRVVLGLYGNLMRENEANGPSAQLYFLLGLCWAIIFLPKTLGIQAILIMSWLDPIAALCGMRFGKRSWNSLLARIFVGGRQTRIDLGAKTIEGSLAGFAAAVIAGLIAWTGRWASVPHPDGYLWWPPPLTILALSAAGGFFAMIAEAWPSQWDDNLNIPFWSGLLLWATVAVVGIPIRFL